MPDIVHDETSDSEMQIIQQLDTSLFDDHKSTTQTDPSPTLDYLMNTEIQDNSLQRW